MQATFGDFDVPSHRSVSSVPEPLTTRVEVVFSDASHWRIRIDDRSGLRTDAIPFAKGCHRRAGFDDSASEFMA